MNEAVCWAFDTVPSRLSGLFWEYSFSDLRTQMQLKIGYEQAKVYQDYQTLSRILAHAFGSKKDGQAPNTVDEAISNFQSLFGNRK
jgi:hypothetical protein